MNILTPIIEMLKNIFLSLAVFIAGREVEKYERLKDVVQIEKERDKIDADPASSPSDILKRMRENDL